MDFLLRSKDVGLRKGTKSGLGKRGKKAKGGGQREKKYKHWWFRNYDPSVSNIALYSDTSSVIWFPAYIYFFKSTIETLEKVVKYVQSLQ